MFNKSECDPYSFMYGCMLPTFYLPNSIAIKCNKKRYVGASNGDKSMNNYRLFFADVARLLKLVGILYYSQIRYNNNFSKNNQRSLCSPINLGFYALVWFCLHHKKIIIT